MSHKSKSPPPPDYSALAQQQAGLDQAAVNYQTTTNRPTQINPFGTIQWAQDPKTGQWVQKETLDPRVQGLINTSLAQQQQQASNLSKLGSAQFAGQPGAALFNASDPGIKAFLQQNPNIAAYDPASGDAFSKQYAQSLLARVLPQQTIDRQQMDVKLRLQGLQPGTEAYDRAYKDMLTSQGDVNTQAQLQGMLAGGQESRDIYNTRLQSALELAGNRRDEYNTALNSAMGLQGNARENYQTRMQGQNQMYDQAMKNYLLPYNTAGTMQSLASGAWSPYMPQYQSFGTANSAPGANMMGAAQQTYAQQVQNANDAAARRAQTGSAVGSAVGSYWGSTGSAVGGAIGSYFSDAALKDDIRVISDEDAYKVMMKIAPYSFSWPSGARAAGLIAQDVADELPALVRVAEGGYLKVNYEAFTALLLGAFRHLAKRSEENAAADAN